MLESMLLLLLFTRPLPRDGGMAEDHGAPEAGQLPRVWTRVKVCSIGTLNLNNTSFFEAKI